MMDDSRLGLSLRQCEEGTALVESSPDLFRVKSEAPNPGISLRQAMRLGACAGQTIAVGSIEARLQPHASSLVSPRSPLH